MTTIYLVKNTDDGKVQNVFIDEQKANRCLKQCKRKAAIKKLLIENGVPTNLLTREGGYRSLTRQFESITHQTIQAKADTLTEYSVVTMTHT